MPPGGNGSGSEDMTTREPDIRYCGASNSGPLLDEEG